MNMPYILYYSLLFTHYSLQTLQYNSTKVTSSAAACRLRQINGRIYYAYHNYMYVQLQSTISHTVHARRLQQLGDCRDQVCGVYCGVLVAVRECNTARVGIDIAGQRPYFVLLARRQRHR